MVILWLSYGYLMVLLLPEEREMYVTVFSLLYEVRMLLETVVRGVLQHKPTALGQQFVRENQIGQGGQLVQCIRRVGEDEVKLLPA